LVPWSILVSRMGRRSDVKVDHVSLWHFCNWIRERVALLMFVIVDGWYCWLLLPRDDSNDWVVVVGDDTDAGVEDDGGRSNSVIVDFAISSIQCCCGCCS